MSTFEIIVYVLKLLSVPGALLYGTVRFINFVIR